MSKLHPLIREYILENYPLFGAKKVGEELNMSPECVSIYAKKNNLKISKINGIGLEIPKFKYNLDFSRLFENINEKLAYWIGFFWADGTVNRHTSMVIEIIKEDGESLKKLFLDIFPFVITERKRKNKKAQITFRVNNKTVGNLLESLGKYPKSCESHEKIMKYLGDKRLQIFFLRGLIDGDGSFYWNDEKKYAQFTLASNYNQNWDYLLKFLEDFNPFISKDINLNGKSSVLRITGRTNIINLIKFLEYETNELGLKRKNDYALNILKKYDNNPPKDWKKHVLQYSKERELLKEWNSIYDAAKFYGCAKSSIADCVYGKTKTSMGFIWKFK